MFNSGLDFCRFLCTIYVQISADFFCSVYVQISAGFCVHDNMENYGHGFVLQG